MVGIILTDIHSDLQLEIFRHLDYRSILSSSAVCNAFQALVNNSPELRYVVELGASSLTSLPCSMAYPERLRLLAEHRANWANLRFKKTITIDIPAGRAAYELGADVFAKVNPKDATSGIWRHLTVVRLPTATFAGQTETIEDVNVDVGVVDFTFDATQDLIAFLEGEELLHFDYRIHLRALSNLNAHPLAKIPIIKHRFVKDPGFLDFIQIIDDLVAVCFHASPRLLLVWDWRDGRLIFCTNIETDSNKARMLFISSRAYVVANANGSGSLDVHTFTTHLGQDLNLPVCRARLLLPLLSERSHIDDVQLQTAPLLAHPPQLFIPSNPSQINQRETPFTASPSPHARVFVVSLDYSSLDATYQYRLFFRAQILLKYAAEGEDVVTVPRPSWGPLNTRFLANDTHWYWLRYVHGFRVVFPVDGGGLRVFDFSPHFQRPALFTQYNPGPESDPADRVSDSSAVDREESKTWGRLVVEPALVSEDIFEEDVVTLLPYWDAARSGRQYHELMLDMDRVISFQSAFSKGKMDVLIL